LKNQKGNFGMIWVGARLRDPQEYDRNSEGYTPFGDEGYGY